MEIEAIIDNRPPIMEADPSGEIFVLTDAMRCRVGIDGIWRPVVVHAGFLTDLASIPPWAWPVAERLGPWNRPAILHDYLYWQGTCSRLVADRIFCAAMRSTGVAALRRALMYAAVRIAGWHPWREYRA